MILFTTDQIAKLEKSNQVSDFQAQLHKFGYTLPSLVMLIKNTYSFTTLNSMSIQQKQAAINLIIQLVYDIPKLNTNKTDFFHTYSHRIQQLAKRTPKNLTPKFSQAQADSIKKFFEVEVLPFYEIYEFILDQNQQFSLKTQIFDPIVTIGEAPIFEGTVVQPETIDVLKQFVGERAPKEEKKDTKKK